MSFTVRWPRSLADDCAELCPACRGLDLSVSRFNIQKGRSGQRRCAKDGSARESQSPLFSPRYANLRFLLGTYRDIETRAPGCPFCRLVSKSIDKSTLSTVDVENAKCFLTWEVDGRSIDENNLTIQARTRRIHINWDSSAIPDAFAVFLTPRESSDLVTTDANAVWTYSDHFRARRINQDASKIALIRSWLEQCLHEHKGRCGDSFERDEVNFKRVAKAAHFGVLDIVEMRLTSLPQRSNGKSPVSRKKSTAASASDSSSDEESDFDSEGSLFEPYVALSYVWGSKEDQQGFEKLLTNLNNVLTRGFRHAIEEDLKGMPKVIQSSVDLVRRLGYRYLWIDSICIVQDSNRSWKWNSQVMDRIYSNAEFTICAADGINAKAGLVAFDSPEASSEQVIERCGPGLRLMISRDVESQIASSAWNSRAWTFQERLLSRRCLIFTQGRVFFQCRKATFSEDIVASPQASKTSAWSLDLVRSPLALLNKLEERPVWFYMHCVELFSGRCLTKSTDVLAAFNGVSNLIESAMSGPLCFGLPTSHFDLALLWTPQEALKRRVGGDFPSWSWCGWEGGSALYFNHDFIQDCLENVHQWLISHTWIQWHIRDSQSKLRPLWLTCERVLRNQEVRWKGYDSHERSKEKMEKGIHEVERKLKKLKEQKEGPDFNGQHSDSDILHSDETSTDADSSFSRKPPPDVRAIYRGRAGHNAGYNEVREYPEAYMELLGYNEAYKGFGGYNEAYRDLGGYNEAYRGRAGYNYQFDPHHEDRTEYRKPPSPIRGEHRERNDSIGSPTPPPPPRQRRRGAEDFSRRADDRRDGDVRVRFSSPGREKEIVYDYGRRRPAPAYNPDNSPHPSRMRREYPEAFPRPNDDVRKRRSRRRKVIEIVRERPDPMLDPYGRRTLEGRRGKKPEFHKRAPESPFAVYGADGISSLYMQEPDSPMLQFWTDSVWLYLVEPNDDTATHPDGPRSRACGLGLCRYGIADAAGDWCGSIILSEEWVLQKMHDNDNKNNGGDLVFQFLALSRAKRFTKDECGTWSFYVPFDQQQSEWDLNYVMLVEVKSSVHYRVGVGKVFRHAFRNGVKGKARWEEIVLG
ncbi:heterokaryon incompatibility protein-domain-containing protein [Phyllosticta citricarpa]